MSSSLSLEDVNALSPDSASIGRARKLARTQDWSKLGTDGRAVWGVCKGSYQTQVDLSGPAFKCSCPSPKFPCKHALGLLMLYVAQNDKFANNEPPEKVAAWLTKRDAASARKANKGAVKDPAAAAKRAQQREQNVARGIEELKRWLADIVRMGLAETRDEKAEFWATMQARMVDAQASGLANRIDFIRNQIGAGSDWPARVFGGLIRLHLLAEAFQGLARLPADMATEIRTLVGWSTAKEDVFAGTPVRDRWLVTGSLLKHEAGITMQRIWLYGLQQQQHALLLNFASAMAPQTLERGYTPGAVITGDAYYYSRFQPLRVLFRRAGLGSEWLHTTDEIVATLPVGINAGTRAFRAAVATNPWREYYPIFLRDLRPVLIGERLHLADASNAVISLAKEFTQSWHLLAASGPAAASFFGEWNGYEFLPLGLFNAHEYIPLATELGHDSDY